MRLQLAVCVSAHPDEGIDAKISHSFVSVRCPKGFVNPGYRVIKGGYRAYQGNRLLSFVEDVFDPTHIVGLAGLSRVISSSRASVMATTHVQILAWENVPAHIAYGSTVLYSVHSHR